jgi:hypothetical protein
MSEDVSSCFMQELPPFSDQVQRSRQPGRPPVSTLLIYHKGHAYPGARWIPSSSIRMLLTKLGGYHEYRGNPRPLAYMKELVDRHIGNIDLVPGHDLSMLSHVSAAQQIVLLWPDANGMGWFEIERQVFKRKQAGSPVYVLNGRRRVFELSKQQWRVWRVKRFLEKSFLLETGVLALFIVTAPVLALWDAIRKEGRRTHD